MPIFQSHTEINGFPTENLLKIQPPKRKRYNNNGEEDDILRGLSERKRSHIRRMVWLMMAGGNWVSAAK